MTETQKKSCWTCHQQQIGGVTFLGLCKFPAKNNPDRNKPIPHNIVDIGCKNWELKVKQAEPGSVSVEE